MSASLPCCDRCGRPLPQRQVGGNCPACLYASVLALLPAETRDGEEPLGTIGEFELLEEIGRGGAGVVYRARQRGVNRMVALKVLKESSLHRREAFERFRIEAEAVGRLEHPHIVPLYEVGRQSGVHFLALRYFEQGSLGDALKGHRFNTREAATLIATIAKAVHFAHQHGVLHRDLKPSNILLDEHGLPHVADFGLAKLAGRESSPTLSTSVLGTPAYMAPEQASGRSLEVGTPADIYSLGAVLFELLTGRPPFTGHSSLEILRQAVECEPPSPRTLNPAVDRDLEAVCLRCLEKDPNRRYASAVALAEDLDRWLRHEPISVRPPTGNERILKWVRRRPLVAALSMGIVSALIAGLGLTTWQWRRAVAARETSLFESYASSLKVISQALEEGRLKEARSRLLAQPARFRGWEWGRLMLLAHPEVFTATLPAQSNAPDRFIDEIDHQLSPDGSLIAASRPDHPLEVHRPRDPSWRKVLGSMEQPVWSGTFSSDSQFLATAGSGPGFTLWNTRDWTPAIRFGTNVHPGRTIALQPAGHLIVTAAPDQPVQVWDLRTGLLRTELAVHEKHAGAFAGFSRDGRRIVRPRSGEFPGSQIGVWNADTLDFIGAFPPFGHSYGIAHLSPDAQRMVTVDTNGMAEAWELGAATPYFRAAAEGPNAVWSADLGGNADRLAVIREPGQLHLWDTRAGRLLASPQVRFNQVHNVSSERFITGNGDRSIRVFDWNTGAELHQLAADSVNIGKQARLSADGRLVSATSADSLGHRTLHAWTLTSGDRRFNDPPSPISGKLSPDGRLAALGHFGSQLTVWDVETGRRLSFLQGHWRWVCNVVWAPDGKHLYSASADHTIRIWRMPEGVLEQTLRHHREPVFRLALSPDGSRLASADLGGTIQVAEVTSGRVLSAWRTGTNLFCWNLSFSPDGRHVAAPSFRTEGGVWEAETGRQVLRFADSRNTAQNDSIAAAFRPDGTELATLDMDGRIRFWDTTSWRVLRTASTVSGALEMQFSADGSRLFLQTTDNSVADAGVSSISVHEGRSGQLLANLGTAVASGSELSFSDATGVLLQTLANSELAGYGASVWESLPWRRPVIAEGIAEEEFYSNLARKRHWQRYDTARNTPRHTEASRWNEPRTNWPSRHPGTPSRCLDLTECYNGHLETGWQPITVLNFSQDDLSALPQGHVTLAGVPWDIRGVITLGRPEFQPQLVWPASNRVDGITVGRRCRRLHFLHAMTRFGGQEGSVGRYRLNYADGTYHDLVLQPALDIGEWWSSNPASKADNGGIAWEGDSVIATQFGARIRLFHRTWDHPSPEKEIRSMDFISDGTFCIPFLVAVTLDP